MPTQFHTASQCGDKKARQNQEERQQRPLDAHQLEHWFANPVVRLILGERRSAIYEHLITSPAK